jgi:putative transposase
MRISIEENLSTFRSKLAALRKLPSLWTRSYFAATAGNVSAETIQRYINQQS